MLWWILYAVGIITLLLHWGRPNAVWGTATLGCVIGVIVALFGGGFDWWTVARSVAIAATLGTVIEEVPRLLERLRQQPRSVPGNVYVKSAESGKPKAAVPPARVRIRDSSGKVWGRVEFSTDGRATLIAEQSSTFVTVILEMAVVFAKDLTDEDRRVFCQWNELPPNDWGEEHYSSLSIAFLSWVAGLTDMERKAHPALTGAADLLAKEPQKPTLEKRLSPAVRQMFGRLFSK